MANPHPNTDNLKPITSLSKEEAKKRGSKGGKRSGQVRKEKKAMSAIYASVLARKYKVKDQSGKAKEISGNRLLAEVAKDILLKRDSASVSMMREMREALEGTKTELWGADGEVFPSTITIEIVRTERED